MAISQWYIRCGGLRSVVRASSAESALSIAIRAENPTTLSRLFYASTVGFRDKNPLYGLTEWVLKREGVGDQWQPTEPTKPKTRTAKSDNQPLHTIAAVAIKTDVELEAARYEDYAAKARSQNCEPFTFEEWQPRWGGPMDDKPTYANR